MLLLGVLLLGVLLLGVLLLDVLEDSAEFELQPQIQRARVIQARVRCAR